MVFALFVSHKKARVYIRKCHESINIGSINLAKKHEIEVSKNEKKILKPKWMTFYIKLDDFLLENYCCCYKMSILNDSLLQVQCKSSKSKHKIY